MDCYFKTACRVNLFPGWCSLCSCGIRLASMTVERRSFSLSDAEQYRLNAPPTSCTKLSANGRGEVKTKVPTPPETGSTKGMFMPTKEELIAQRKLLKNISAEDSARNPIKTTIVPTESTDTKISVAIEANNE